MCLITSLFIISVGRVMYEIRITNTLNGFVIHNLIPVFFNGKNLWREPSESTAFIYSWCPMVISHIKTLPPDLQSKMHQYWYSLDRSVTDEEFWATRFLKHGTVRRIPGKFCTTKTCNGILVNRNYWELTMDSALPFLDPNGPLSLHNVLKNYPRGRIYSCESFRRDISQAVGKEVAARFITDPAGDVILYELRFLFYEGHLMDHPETLAGKNKLTNTHYHNLFDGSAILHIKQCYCNCA